jgi:Spy/CpxP family protein refolding chaperone
VFLFYVRTQHPNQEEHVKFINSKLTVLAASLALFAGIAMAQDEAAPSGPRGHGMHGHFMGGGELGLPLHELNLTDDQKAQVKQIFQTEKPTMKPLMQQEMAAHQQLIQLVTSGSFDQSKAAAIAAQESLTHQQLEVEHAKIASQVYQLLTADQKAKVAEMIAKHQQRMQEHMQGKDEPAPPSE